MKKVIVLLLLAQLISCESVHNCSFIVRGKPDHLISGQDLNTVISLFDVNHLSLNNFQVYKLQKDELGYNHVRCYQYINDLNVFSNQVIFHFNSYNHYYFLSGDIISAIDIAPVPVLNKDSAATLFLERMFEDNEIIMNPDRIGTGCISCELGYWDLNAGISYAGKNFVLAWRVRREGQTYPYAIINDNRGNVILYDNGIRYEF